jgi:hypothetical protein
MAIRYRSRAAPAVSVNFASQRPQDREPIQLATALQYTPDVTMRKSFALLLLVFPLCGSAADSYRCPANDARLQQLRIYEIKRDNRGPFHQRFQDHALRIMKKYGFNVVDMWESDTGEKLQLVYVLDWPDQATMDNAWKAFLADAEWIAIKKRSAEEHGQLVIEAKGQPLVRLSYSPSCKGTK